MPDGRRAHDGIVRHRTAGACRGMADHSYFANLIWQIADLLRGPYRPPQYERAMLPMTVLRRFDCVLAPSKAKVLAEYERRKGGRVEGDALDLRLNRAAGQRFHNRSPLDFRKLEGDPDNIERHLVAYVNGFSRNVREIFEFFEFENEIERMREANLLYLVVSRFGSVDLHPDKVPNEQMGLIFENLIRRFNELANETAGDHFTPREVIRLMVSILFIEDDGLLAPPARSASCSTPPAAPAACWRRRRTTCASTTGRRGSTSTGRITTGARSPPRHPTC